MKFSEEYKKSVDSMSPDKGSIDRMKAAVLARLESEKEAPAPAPERKKPIFFRRIAAIGGAAAACAVLTIAAVNIVNRNGGSGLVGTGNNITGQMADTAGTMSETAAAEISEMPDGQQECAPADDFDEVVEEAADEAPDAEWGAGAFDAAIAESPAEEKDQDMDAGAADSIASDKGYSADIFEEASEVTADEVPAEIDAVQAPTHSTSVSADAGTLYYSGEASLEFDGRVYVLTNSPDPGEADSARFVVNSADLSEMLLYINGDRAVLYDGSGGFIGVFAAE